MPAIEVQNLSKHFGSVRAVDDVSFVVEPGEVVGFLGPNGAGKTTTMRILTGFLPASDGRVRIDGHDTFSESLQARRAIGYLPETPPLYPEMKVAAYVRYVTAIKGVPRSERRAAVVRALERCGLVDVADRVIGTLSKGYRQRVGLAQAIVHDPPVLVLDEPTVGLDPIQIQEIRTLISGVVAPHEDRRRQTVVLSTHILDEAERICTRALILSEGKILVDSTPGDLMAQAPDHNVVRVSFEDQVPEGVAGELCNNDWCESATVLEDGRLEIRPHDGQNHLADILELLRGRSVNDIDLHQGRLDDLFRDITKGVAA